MEFKDNLRNLRIQRGMNQKELAERLDTSQSAVSGWELGKRNPDYASIQKIALFFGVPITSLTSSDRDEPSTVANEIAESLHQNPKLKLLFDRSKFLCERDLDAVLSVVNAISRERDGDD